jgi:hypothetical protein
MRPQDVRLPGPQAERLARRAGELLPRCCLMKPEHLEIVDELAGALIEALAVRD